MGTKDDRLDIIECMQDDIPCVVRGDEFDPIPGSQRPANWKRNKRAKKRASKAAKKRNRRPK